VADTEQGRTEGWTEADVFTSATETTVYELAQLRPIPEAPVRPAARRPRRAAARPIASSRPVSAGAAASREVIPRLPEPEALSSSTSSPRESTGRLPTAREILAAQRLERIATPTPRRKGTEPLPTVGQAPSSWRVPLWLGWVPATVATVVVGAIATVAAWCWSIEALHSGVVANRLARSGNGPRLDPLPLWVTPPNTNWWATTSGHLMLWALWLDRTASDPAGFEEARERLAAAARVSPMQATVRYALACLDQGPAPAPALAPASANLALSRDVLPLAWTGHRLRAAGKKDAAVRAYRAALEIAAQADLSRLAAPSFLDDTQIRRYALPAEELVGPILRDMADSPDWTYAEWSAALPSAPVVRLAAVRLLRERGSPDADAALEALLSEDGSHTAVPVPQGTAAALALAARAEALALKQRWSDAEQHYRQAIELMPDLTFRRSWWMNLAEIALRQNDESGRQKALEAARGNDPNDEITRRAVELLKYYGVRTERIDGRTPPNITAN
jgi:tetratricopeptide (TPR) repeat protein